MHHDVDHGPVFLRIYQDRATQSLLVGCDRFQWHLEIIKPYNSARILWLICISKGYKLINSIVDNWITYILYFHEITKTKSLKGINISFVLSYTLSQLCNEKPCTLELTVYVVDEDTPWPDCANYLITIIFVLYCSKTSLFVYAIIWTILKDSLLCRVGIKMFAIFIPLTL